MRNNMSFLFATVGAALIAVFLIALNVLFSAGFPWSIFPVFAVLWWPLSIYSYQKKGPLFLSVAGSVLLIVFFIMVNYITSAGFPWSIFPVFAVLWWPLSIYSYQKKGPFFLSVAGSVLLIVFFIVVNYITSPGFAWYIYPIFAVLWWPLSLYCGLHKNFTLLSVAGSFLIIALLFITELLVLTNTGWVFCAVFPVCLWPVCMAFKKYVKHYWFHIFLGIITIGYYIVLNVIVFPGYPWSLFVTYGIIQIMIGSYFLLKQKGLWLLLVGVVITFLFMIVNIVLMGRSVIWIYELALLIACGQTGVYLWGKKKYYWLRQLSIAATLLLLILNNILYTPGYLWVLYTVFPFVWLWVMMIFPKNLKSIWFAVMSALTGIVYYIILNMYLSPGHLWIIYPGFALIWWPLAVYFVKTKKHLVFALVGSIITIIFLILVNLLTTPHIVWCVFPIFLVVWWPLSIYYFIYKSKKIIIRPGR